MNLPVPAVLKEKSRHFLYINSNFQKTFKKVLDDIVYGRQCCLLVGPSGVGKTKMLKRLIDILGASIQPFYFDKAYQSFDDVIADLVQILNLAPESGQDLESLVSSFERLQKASSPIVLIFDNIDRYGEHVFSPLFAFIDNIRQKHKSMSIVFSGQSDLSAAWDGCFQNNNIEINRYEIKPLPVHEVEKYIYRYLNFLEIDGQVNMIDSATSKIAEISAGIPGVINKIIEDVISNADSPLPIKISGDLIEYSTSVLITEENKNPGTSIGVDSGLPAKVDKLSRDNDSRKELEDSCQQERKPESELLAKVPQNEVSEQTEHKSFDSFLQEDENQNDKKHKTRILLIIPLILLLIAIVLINHGIQIKREYQSQLSHSNAKK